MKKDTAFGIVPILDREDKFLLIQHHAGHWGFPKGHPISGESAIATACREFEEETGIKDYDLFGNISFIEKYNFIRAYKIIQKTVTYFPAIVRSKTVVYQKAEIKNYAWLSLNDAMQKFNFSQTKQLIIEVDRYFQDWKKSQQ